MSQNDLGVPSKPDTDSPATGASVAGPGRSGSGRRGPGAEPVAAAKTPVSSGRIATVGLLLSVLVIGLGVLAVQTALVAVGLLHGVTWLTWLINAANGLTPVTWVLVAGIVAVLLGLWLLWSSVRRRPRTAVALRAATGVFLRPRDLAALAVTAADDVDGVSDAHASATRTKVTLRITTTGDRSVGDAVKTAVTQRLEPLDKPVRINVKTTGGAR